MNILLLRPVPANERFGLGPFFRIEPLGMEYIATALEAAGHRVTLADLRFSGSLERIMRRVRPDLVGVAAMHALESDEVTALARQVRALSPDVPIVIGGHTAAAYPEPFLSPDIAAVVLDDGERALPAVCKALSRGFRLDTVPGLALPDGDGGMLENSRGKGDAGPRRGPAAGAASRSAVAQTVRLPGASPGVAGRDGARLPFPLFLLFDLAAARARSA